MPNQISSELSANTDPISAEFFNDPVVRDVWLIISSPRPDQSGLPVRFISSRKEASMGKWFITAALLLLAFVCRQRKWE